jgi:hypothetical protein
MHHAPRLIIWKHTDYAQTSYYHLRVFNAATNALIVEASDKPPQDDDGDISRPFGAESIPAGTSVYFTVEAVTAAGEHSAVTTSDPFTIVEAIDKPTDLESSDDYV